MEATSAPRPLAARLPVPRRVLAAFSDERLVEHVRRGDTHAFEVLYDRYSAGVLAFCRHLLGSASDAEDAVQHTFIAAHNDLQRNSGREIHFKAWLYTIARNRCLSMLRARREQTTDEIEIVSDRMSEEVQQRAELRALLLDVHKLPDEQREALVLSELGDLSHADVAEVLGCEAGKVKSLVFQARSSLIERRLARETPCQEIREQLATLRGGSLRRSHLRHHLEACPGCSAFREQVRRQRAMLAVALPVIPSAGLRGDVLAAVGIGGGTATAAATGAGGLALAAKGGLAKAGVVALLAGGTAGGATVVNNGTLPLVGDAPATSKSSSGSGTGSGGGSATPAVTAGDEQGEAKDGGPQNRSERGKERGFMPTRGESNGERAREFAATRGKGKKKGLATERRRAAQRRRANRRARARGRSMPAPRTLEPRTRTAPTPQRQPTRTTTEPTPTTTAPEPLPDAEEPEPTPTPTATTPLPVPDASGGRSGGSKKLQLGAG